MTKFIQVAGQEIGYHLRQWTFYLTAIGMPLIFAALGALPRLQAISQETPLANIETIFNQSETLTVPTGYVDYAEIIQVVPQTEAANFRAYDSESAATLALQRGEIESYYVIAADYIHSGSVSQYSSTPQLLADSDGAVVKLLQDNLRHALDDPSLAARLATPVKLIRRGPPPPLFSLIPANLDSRQLISAGLVILLFAYVLNISGNLILRSLQREAQARILEVMVVNTTPEQLIGGKIAGLAALSLTQVGLALLAGALVYGQNSAGFGPAALPWPALALSLPYLLLGYLAYCGGMMAVAAVWPRFPESTSLLAMARLAALLPVLGVVFILPDPAGTIAVGLSLFPLTAPLLMPFRLLLNAAPLWQWGVGLFGLLLWAAGSIWLSMRLFRAHALLTGRAVTPKAVWVALRG